MGFSRTFSIRKMFHILFISDSVNYSDHRFNLFESFLQLRDSTNLQLLQL